MIQSPTLYKLDSKGKLRIWYYELDGASWRVVSGLEDGKHSRTGWNTPDRPKSQPTLEAQALFEANASFQKQLDTDYYDSREEALKGVPKMFVCMTAKKYQDLKDPESIFKGSRGSTGVLVQPKLDGIRCLFRKAGAFTRGNERIESVSHLGAYLAPFFEQYPDAVLDGELYNHDFADNFNEIAGLIRRGAENVERQELIQYHVYDCWWPNSSRPYGDRLAAYYSTFGDVLFTDECPLYPVQTEVAGSTEQIQFWHEHFLSCGYEGSMIRLPDAPYEQKRSKNLLKNKKFETAEFTILEVNEGVGNWAGCAKSFRVRCKETGVEHDSGIRGSQEFLAQVLAEKDQYVGGDATIRFDGRSEDKVPRFPVIIDLFKGKRND